MAAKSDGEVPEAPLPLAAAAMFIGSCTKITNERDRGGLIFLKVRVVSAAVELAGVGSLLPRERREKRR